MKVQEKKTVRFYAKTWALINNKEVLIMNNKIYDISKWVAIIVLPAASTFVASVFPLWDLPYADAIAQTITAVGTFLGAVLMVSNINYKNGDNAEDKNGDE